MEGIKIVPTYEVYYNEESMWGVYKAKSLSDIDKKFVNSGVIEIVGNSPRLQIGCEYIINGEGILSKKFGRYQIELNSCPKLQDMNNKESQEKYLLAILTDTQTKVLLEKYPNLVNDILDKKEINADGLKYINETKLKEIKDRIIDNNYLSELLILLQPLGVSYKKIQKISQKYKDKEVLMQNPYLLTSIDGFGFKTVDGIALKLNPSLRKDKKRLFAYVEYLLFEIANNDGHTFINIKDLKINIRNDVPELFEIFDDVILENKNIICEGDILYLKYFFDKESELYMDFARLAIGENILKSTKSLLEESILETESKQDFKFTDEQKLAARSIIENNVITIQGKSGSGKTNTLKSILDFISNKTEFQIYQCALSAKAARRMTEVTGKYAQTIHLLLAWKDGEFQYNAENQLPVGIYVLDEASMVNVVLFADLLQAIPNDSKLILVFDNAQLPPIGAGCVSIDILKSKLVKHNYLTKVHRQATLSGILSDANKIREGINPIQNVQVNPIVSGQNKDMKYFLLNSNEKIVDMGIKAFKGAYENNNVLDISIITPMNTNGKLCCNVLNKEIQDYVVDKNKETQFIKVMDTKIYLNDKIIQYKNNYNKDVVNGEIGLVKEITKITIQNKETNKEVTKEVIRVNFDGKIVEYEIGEIASNIRLAYALSCHKMQGSESKIVIVLFSRSQYIMLDRAWLYTAITRAKEKCLVACDYKGFMFCIQNNRTVKRNTLLSKMIEGDIKYKIKNTEV